MLKENYWLTQYLSISRIIYKTKAKYENSFLYTESDSNDIGYFITYNLDVLSKAFDGLKRYLQKKQAEQRRPIHAHRECIATTGRNYQDVL